MTILILHRVHYSKVRYGEVIDHQLNEVIYFGSEAALASIPPDLKCEKMVNDMPELSLTNAVLQKWAGRRAPDHLMALSEYDLLAAAEIRERLSIAGPRVEEVKKIRNKMLMKKEVEKFGLIVPKNISLIGFFKSTSDQRQKWSGPVVLKPLEGASSEDVIVFDSAEKLFDALTLGKTEIKCLDTLDLEHWESFEVEEFISGSILHFDGFVREGELQEFVPSSYLGTCLDYAKGSPLGSFQIEDPLGKCRAWTELCIKALQIENGAFHLESILSPERGLIFLEIGHRVGGAGVAETFQRKTGINLYHAHLLAMLREETPKSKSPSSDSFGWFVFPGHHLQTQPHYHANRDDFQSQESAEILEWRVRDSAQPQPSRQITYQAGEVPLAGVLRGRSSQAIRSLMDRIFRSLSLQAQRESVVIFG